MAVTTPDNRLTRPRTEGVHMNTLKNQAGTLMQRVKQPEQKVNSQESKIFPGSWSVTVVVS